MLDRRIMLTALLLPQIKTDFTDTGKVQLIYGEVFFDRPALKTATS